MPDSPPFDPSGLHLYDFDEIHNIDVYAVEPTTTTLQADIPIQYFFRVPSGYIPTNANADNIYTPPIIKIWYPGHATQNEMAKELATILENQRKCIAPINTDIKEVIFKFKS